MFTGAYPRGTRPSIRRQHEKAHELPIEECILALQGLGVETETRASATVLPSSGEVE